jgi:hypothetical protein
MSGTNVYAIRVRGGIAEVEWSRIPTFSDIKRALTEVIQHKDYHVGMALLFIDCAAIFNPTSRMIEIGIKSVARYARHFDRHIAFVIEKETHYEIGRICAARAESRGIILMPFREIHTARQWLAAQMSDSNSFPVPAD